MDQIFVIFCNISLSQGPLVKLFSAEYFPCNDIFPLCVATNSVRHNVHFRTKALNGIEIVGASVNSGRLASAEWLWAVVSGQ